MMYELNVSPLGEIYEAIPTTTTTMMTRSNNDHVLVKGEEDRALKRSKKNKKKKMEPTMYCEATMTVTTEAVCCGAGRRLATGNTADDDVEPWMAPNHNQAELIAKNPGIWKIPDILDQSLVQRMLETFTNNFDNRFERCNGQAHSHLKCKQCFRLSPSSSSNNSVDTAESKLVQEITENIQYLWPSEAPQRDYLYVQSTEPDCDATLVPKDATEHDFARGLRQPSSFTCRMVVLASFSPRVT
jgi:hypothetical protein